MILNAKKTSKQNTEKHGAQDNRLRKIWADVVKQIVARCQENKSDMKSKVLKAFKQGI